MFIKVSGKTFYHFVTGWTVLILLVGLCIIRFQAYEIIPLDENEFFIGAYDEGKDSNNTKARVKVDSQRIYFDYELSEEFEEPFAGVYIKKRKEGAFMDLSKFNCLALNIEAEYGTRIPVTITVNHEGFTEHAKRFPRITYSHELEYKEPGTYYIDLSSFEISSWWLRFHKLQKKDFPELDLTRVRYVIVASCKLLGAGQADHVKLNEITFFMDNTERVSWLSGLWFFGVCTLLLLRVYQQRKKVLIPYQSQELNIGETKIEQVVAYLAKAYSNSTLTAEDVQKELGLNSREAGQLIKEEFGMSFKAYLNMLRLAEVKRVLKETDLTISEAAYGVGYNSVPHFNRIFKTAEGMSPADFKKANK